MPEKEKMNDVLEATPTGKGELTFFDQFLKVGVWLLKGISFIFYPGDSEL